MKPALYETAQGIVGDLGELQTIPFFLTPNAPNDSILIDEPGHVMGPLAMTAPKDGPLLLRSLHANRVDYDCFAEFEMQDGSETRKLCNAPIYLRTILGQYALPYYLPQYLFLPENGVIYINIQAISAMETALCLNFEAVKMLRKQLDMNGKMALGRIERRSILSVPYFATFQNGFLDLDASGSNSAEIQIPYEGSFLARKISYHSTGTLKLNIINQATKESMILAPRETSYEVPVADIIGTSGQPLDLIEPWHIGAGQKLLITATDTSGSANRFYLTIGGEFIRTGDMR